MADDPPGYVRPPLLERAVAIHGTDTDQEYSVQRAVLLFQVGLLLLPILTLAGLLVGAAFAPKKAAAGLAGGALLLAWSALVSLAGLCHLFAGMRMVALSYKDRLVLGWGSTYEVIPWADVEAVHIRTHITDDQNYWWDAGSERFLVWIKVRQPIAKFWLEWTDVRTKDGRTFRIPSTFTSYDGLCEEVQGEAFCAMWPRYKAESEAGRPIEFGPLVVSRPGLTVVKSRIPWSKHESTTRANGRIVTLDINDRQIGPAVPTEQIANLAIAMYLISKAHEAAGGTPSRVTGPEDED